MMSEISTFEESGLLLALNWNPLSPLLETFPTMLKWFCPWMVMPFFMGDNQDSSAYLNRLIW
jgi:hypothetical protein